jgi:1-acyl-sn-glycerol-3-phosphate acyltransferase
MNKWFSKIVLKLCGWTATEYPNIDKCVIGIAPHTSMWDFLWGKLFLGLHGVKAQILIKKEMFFFPLGPILKMMGGIPVDRRKPKGLVEDIRLMFSSQSKLVIAITPEGTRARTTRWKKGFINIAQAAGVPILVGFIDYKTKQVGILDQISANGEIDTILQQYKDFYKNISAKHIEKFTLDNE